MKDSLSDMAPETNSWVLVVLRRNKSYMPCTLLILEGALRESKAKHAGSREQATYDYPAVPVNSLEDVLTESLVSLRNSLSELERVEIRDHASQSLVRSAQPWTHRRNSFQWSQFPKLWYLAV
jgi:hypothetical protein